LHPNSKYRIYGKAYSASNQLISQDASSCVNLTLTDNDTVSMLALPVNLVKTPFGAAATVSISTNAFSFDYIKATLYLPPSGTPVRVAQTTLKSSQLGFSNLQANSIYQLVGELYKQGSLTATNSVLITVTNDNTLAPLSLLLTAPVIPTFTSVTTVAGISAGFADGPTSTAKFYQPRDVVQDHAGNLYVADCSNQRIRKITPDGVVSTVAGNGNSAFADGTGDQAAFYYPTDLAIDSADNLYVTDTNNDRIRKISPAGVVTTIAGSTRGFANGQGTAAMFNQPYSIDIDSSGNLIVADTYNERIRRISTTGMVTTIAGNGTAGANDGASSVATFKEPFGVAIAPDGTIYVSDHYNARIRKISPAGVVSTFVGNGTQSTTDGNGVSATVNYPCGIDVDDGGNVFVAEYGGCTIRKITTSGTMTTITGGNGYADGNLASARFAKLYGISLGLDGALYVAEGDGNRIRKLY
jgi:sugar lactone lactonase YvrE